MRIGCCFDYDFTGPDKSRNAVDVSVGPIVSGPWQPDNFLHTADKGWNAKSAQKPEHGAAS
jgi:hypothetical protein